MVEEQETDRGVLSGECDGFVKEELDVLLGEFEEVFSDIPGNTDRVKMCIDTGSSPPINISIVAKFMKLILGTGKTTPILVSHTQNHTHFSKAHLNHAHYQ